MPYDAERHGPRRVVGPGFHERVYEVVSMVPRGRVTTYGDVAARLGLRSAARQVGFALAALPAGRDDVPWHRVVSGEGRLAMRGDGRQSGEQVRRLVAEGCTVDSTGRIEQFTVRRYPFPEEQTEPGSAQPHGARDARRARRYDRRRPDRQEK